MAVKTQEGTLEGDYLSGTSADDTILGLGGDDLLIDIGRRGATDSDTLNGGSGNDRIYGHWGADILLGGAGNDILVSRSDAGEPAIAQDPSLPKVYPNEILTATDDTLNGGIGSDTFLFRFDMNATAEAIAAHTSAAGEIDWAAIHDESIEPHHSWLESIGNDTIADFYRGEGDHIVIDCDCIAATIEYQDTTGDGRIDMSLITLRVDPAIAGPNAGDEVGTIRVFGDKVFMEDLIFLGGAAAESVEHEEGNGVAGDIYEAYDWADLRATAGDDVLHGRGTGDRLSGQLGNDTIVDATRQGDKGEDLFSGGNGNDRIYSHWGSDELMGGDGDDILVSRCDAGEPDIAQKTDHPKLNGDEPYLASNDKLTGGLGADTFQFRLDVDARSDILARHTDANGVIDWQGVTGENRHVHDHWVEAIGVDTITDFYASEGDQIVIEGHTVEAFRLAYRDTDGDGRTDTSVIFLRSNQGATGAHNKDLLGQIVVQGEKVTWDMIHVDSMQHYGVGTTVDDFMV